MSTHSQKTPAPETGGGRILVMHIGDHKTGSTSVQEAFAGNAVRFAGAKVHYPTELNHSYLLKHFAAFEKGKTLPDQQPDKPGFRGLGESIARSDAAYNLISGEVFEHVDPALFHKMIRTHFKRFDGQIRILAYVRPHAARILSSYAEQTKIGWFQNSLAKFFTNNKERSRRFHFAPRFRAWRDEFGEDFILRPMIRPELYQHSVTHDLVRTGFGTTDFTVEDTGSANESLGLQDLMRIKYLQSHFQNEGRWLRNALGWEMHRLLAAEPSARKQGKLQLYKVLAEQIRDTYLEDARILDAEFFDGRPLLENELNQSVENARPKPQSFDPRKHFPEADLRTLTVIAGMIRDMLKNGDEDAWKTHFGSDA